MTTNPLEATLKKLLELVQEAVTEGHGEVTLKVTVVSNKVSMVHLSKTQSIRVSK